jgi:hypothetical protein
MELSGSPLCKRCGAEDENSAHILKASLRHAYLGSFLGPEDMKSIILRATWNFSKVSGFF